MACEINCKGFCVAMKWVFVWATTESPGFYWDCTERMAVVRKHNDQRAEFQHSGDFMSQGFETSVYQQTVGIRWLI